jgi:hypothetical protein
MEYNLFEGEIVLINGYSITIKFKSLQSDNVLHVTNIYGLIVAADKA